MILTPFRKAVSNVLSESGLSLNILVKLSTIVLFISSLSEISFPLGEIRASIVQLREFSSRETPWHSSTSEKSVIEHHTLEKESPLRTLMMTSTIRRQSNPVVHCLLYVERMLHKITWCS